MAFAFLDIFRDVGDNGQPEPRLQVMIIILIISLFAVSFPGVSASIPFLRIPHVVFFIGKHFGTGVILATAFIHLLQDSFEALQKPQVKEHFYNVGKHTGLLMYVNYSLFSPPGSLLYSLASLLSIFLIEYLSTSYVEYLQEEPSLPPTPVSSHPPSPQQSRRSTLKSPSPGPTSAILTIPETSLPLDSVSQQTRVPHVQPSRTDETTPLLRPPRTQSTPYLNPPYTHANCHAHHTLLPAIATQDAASIVPIEVLTNSPRIMRMRGCTCVIGHACACPASAAIHPHPPLSKDIISRQPSRSSHKSVAEPLSSLAEGEGLRVRSIREEDDRQEGKPTIGRKRQVVGLLVLQLGIMIHSMVIGLTLAIAAGADFTSLTTAVVFHQLFEGLSLGIRIAALPPPPSDGNSDEESGTRDSSKPDSYRRFVRNAARTIGGERGEGWLKCSLAVLFAITTPAGLGLGMIAFKVGEQKQGIELARMYLIQGLMSAISAGMLIYVSTVEMIAGDFVFGDVEGHSHHGHGHSHDLPSAEDEERALQDRTKSSSLRSGSIGQPLSGEENSTEAAELDDSDFQYHHHHRHGKIGKKVLAVLSLLAGVGGMVLIGLGE